MTDDLDRSNDAADAHHADVAHDADVEKKRIEAAVREILEAIGEDPDRDGLRRTPTRIADMYATRSSPDSTRIRPSTSPSRSRPTTTRW